MAYERTRRTLHRQMTEKKAANCAAMKGVPIEKIEGSEQSMTDPHCRGATFTPAQSTDAIEDYFDDLETALKAGQQKKRDAK